MNTRFFDAYIECAFWSSINSRHYDDPNEPENLDATGYDPSPDLLERMRLDCDDFQSLSSLSFAGWARLLEG